MKSMNIFNKVIIVGVMAIFLGFAIVKSDPVLAQTWTELSPTGVPLSSRAAEAVYDPATNQMIIFGGRGGEFDTIYNEVWRLTDANGIGAPAWIQETPLGPIPRGRWIHRVAYDQANDRMIVFGGGLGRSSPCTNEVWVLVDASAAGGQPTWINLINGGPGARFAHSQVYDPTTNKLVVFGGSNCFTAASYGDVWVLSNANGLGGSPVWTQLPLPSLFRSGHTAVYDDASNRMVVFGGQVPSQAIIDEVWVLTDANGIGTPQWNQLLPAAGPAARLNHTAVYDAAANEMIVFAGQTPGFVNDVWILSNANGLGTPEWTEVVPLGSSPSPRCCAKAMFDPGSNRMIVYSGQSGSVEEVWVLSFGGIEVEPLEYDFGGVNAFTSEDTIVTIRNSGGSDLTVDEITLSGDPSFSATPLLSLPDPVIVLAPGDVMDVTVTFFPTDANEGVKQATITISSDDPADEGIVEVSLIGNGLEGAVEDQSTVLEAAIDDAITAGTLVGDGSGKSANGRLNAFVNMVDAAGDLIEAGYIEDACGQLKSALRRVDGLPRPPDFVTGEAATLIADQIEFLRESLGCN